MLAVIGRNRTNADFVERSIDTPLAGAAPGSLTGIFNGTQGVDSRGREVAFCSTFWSVSDRMVDCGQAGSSFSKDW